MSNAPVGHLLGPLLRNSMQTSLQTQGIKSLPLPPHMPSTTSTASHASNRNFVYLRETDTLLFSATQTVRPSATEVKFDFKHEDPDPEELFELRFELSQYLQIAATPDDMELKYMGPLLQRLATIQIVTHGITHALSAEQKTSWQWLEDTLHHVASVFSTDCLLPLRFRMLPLPSSYGYTRNHKTYRYALQCAKRSRLAFHSLLGLVNLFYGRVLGKYEAVGSFNSPRPPSPSRMLLESGLSEAHVSDIMNALRSETLGRCVGVVLDPRTSEWGFLFPYLNRIRVPVWLKVGRQRGPYNPKTFKSDQFKMATPREDEKLRIGTIINKAISEEVISEPSDVNLDSLHRWNALVDTRKVKEREFFSGASETIKERVRKRLEDAVKFILPTRRDGTRFFVWYRSRKGRFRGEIDYEDAKKEFESRSRGNFVYDEVSNQWDICSLFENDPDVIHDDAVVYCDPAVEFNEAKIQETMAPIPAPAINKPPILPSDHNDIGRNILYSGDIREDILFSDSLENVLFGRYGLVCHAQSEIQSQVDFTTIEEPQMIDTYTVRKYLMEMNLPLLQQKNEFSVQYFVSCLVQDITPPSIMWDLHPGNIQQLIESDVHFKVQTVKDVTCTGYMIIPCVEKYSRPWNLLIDSPVSVIQCIRERWGPSLEDVILCLFERGIKFKVFCHVWYPPVPRPKTVFQSNLRSPGWEPDKYEYVDYELRRNRLLRLPHVRAVAAQGGIIWRLCKQELASDIPSGPSRDVHFFADMSQNKSHQYLFDTLTQAEIETLCGLYYVGTGRGDQITTLSWWPTPTLWSTSGLDVGYWTHSAEKNVPVQAYCHTRRTGKVTNDSKMEG
ncbi:hypothetical protein BDR07DRAFT_1490605 [Suillus spraguei]|nr:hypothetical protein BDR07DRAFT_1490605 [Suillus spraguei]